MTSRREKEQLEQLAQERRELEELLNQVQHSNMPPRFADVVRRAIDRLSNEGE